MFSVERFNTIPTVLSTLTPGGGGTGVGTHCVDEMHQMRGGCKFLQRVLIESLGTDDNHLVSVHFGAAGATTDKSGLSH